MELIAALLPSIPWILLWLAAAVVAGLRWNRHPVVSALVVTSAALHLLTTVGSRVLPMVFVRRSLTEMTVVSTAMGLVGLVGSCCLVAAVFIGRPATDPPPHP